MRFLNVAERQAQDFANEKGKVVYIAKANKLNKFRILFDESELTPNYHIYKKVEPIKKND